MWMWAGGGGKKISCFLLLVQLEWAWWPVPFLRGFLILAYLLGSIIDPRVKRLILMWVLGSIIIPRMLWYGGLEYNICALWWCQMNPSGYKPVRCEYCWILNTLYCVKRAPLLYFIRTWVALSFKVCPSVRKACVTPVQISTLCNIYRHECPLLTQYHQLPTATAS